MRVKGIRVSYWARIALVLGVALMIGLAIRESAVSIVGLLKEAGWILLLLVPLHTAPLFLDVVGWRVLILEPAHMRSLFVIATIREAVNRLLPVANVGGELVGVRLLAQRGVRGSTAAASVIVEMVIHVVALYLFVVFGLVCLFIIADGIVGSSALLVVIVIPLAMGVLVVWLVKKGALLKLADHIGARTMIARVGSLVTSGKTGQLNCAVSELSSAYSRLSLSLLLQLMGLIVGCLETWLALRWLGHPLSFEGALILESTTLAIRSVFFVAPAGLGVQEAGLIGIGYMLGVSGDVAVALSLAKRMREILFGLPALAAWYRMTRPKSVMAV
jgi:putative membrane protein